MNIIIEEEIKEAYRLADTLNISQLYTLVSTREISGMQFKLIIEDWEKTAYDNGYDRGL